MAKKFDANVIKEKMILDSGTHKPLKEIYVEGDKIVAVKENGDKVEIPLNTIRGKYILMRLETGISEITEPIYV